VADSSADCQFDGIDPSKIIARLNGGFQATRGAFCPRLSGPETKRLGGTRLSIEIVQQIVRLPGFRVSLGSAKGDPATALVDYS
jgi:hypothetical protein